MNYLELNQIAVEKMNVGLMVPKSAKYAFECYLYSKGQIVAVIPPFCLN